MARYVEAKRWNHHEFMSCREGSCNHHDTMGSMGASSQRGSMGSMRGVSAGTSRAVGGVW